MSSVKLAHSAESSLNAPVFSPEYPVAQQLDHTLHWQVDFAPEDGDDPKVCVILTSSVQG